MDNLWITNTRGPDKKNHKTKIKIKRGADGPQVFAQEVTVVEREYNGLRPRRLGMGVRVYNSVTRFINFSFSSLGIARNASWALVSVATHSSNC